MPPTRSARQRRIEALAQRDFERHAARRAGLEVPLPKILVMTEGRSVLFEEYIRLVQEQPARFGLPGADSVQDFWDSILGDKS